METITWSNINIKEDEAAARGTQIKRILGIEDNSPFTAEQLIYIKSNIARFTEIDNSLRTFMDTIIDFEEAAAWLSKNAYSQKAAMTLLDYDFLKKPRGLKGL